MWPTRTYLGLTVGTERVPVGASAGRLGYPLAVGHSDKVALHPSQASAASDTSNGPVQVLDRGRRHCKADLVLSHSF
jgi:hypothetical protein